MDICPVCDGEVVIDDGAYPVHYRSSLYRCEGSGQPVPEEEPKPVKKAAPRKKAPTKK